MEFVIDDTATIGSIINALKQQCVKTGDVAKVIDGVSGKQLRAALQSAGYDFRNTTPKGWYYKGCGEEPTNKSIFEYVKSSSSNMKHNLSRAKLGTRSAHTEFTQDNTYIADNEFTSINTKVTSYTSEIVPNSTIAHPQFTQREVAMIMEMLYEWQQKKQLKQSWEVEGKINLHERIKTLPKNNKTRKTIVIDELIGKRLDDFCENEKVNKSDVMHLALIDFLNKYK